MWVAYQPFQDGCNDDLYDEDWCVTGLWTIMIYIDEDFDLCKNLNYEFMIMNLPSVCLQLTVYQGLLRTTEINQ